MATEKRSSGMELEFHGNGVDFGIDNLNLESVCPLLFLEQIDFDCVMKSARLDPASQS